MSQKKNVAIVFGGKSAEHDVSIMSAKNVAAAIDTDLFKVVLVYVDRKGEFYKLKNIDKLTDKKSREKMTLEMWKKIDVAFPVMHGPNCEDGTMQGFFKTLNIPFVGPSVLGSALGMDKDLQKQVARFNGIKVTDWIAINSFELTPKKLKEIKSKIKSQFNYPVFVKPANMGSSVGVSKVKTEKELESALVKAFEHDKKIVIEKAVIGREIECAILGKDGDLIASVLGEVISMGSHEFYDYEAKYFDENGSRAVYPAENISAKKVKEIQELAKRSFAVLECRGLSRIDFFLTENGEIYLNEINTLPGFTNISMYPKLMSLSGFDYKNLITKLIELAEL